MRLFVAFVLSGALLCAAAESPAARWEGVVQIPGRELRLVIDLAQDAQGQWAGSAIAPDAAVKGAPLTDIAVRDTEVAFTIPGALGGPRLKGRVDGGTFRGEYQQAGNTAPFLLERTGPPQVDPPRRSTPVPREIVGEWQGDLTLNGNKLRATITLINTPGGGAAAQFVVVGKRRTEIPVDLVTEEEGLLTLQSDAFHLSFEGRIRAGSAEIAGAFLQGPIETPLVLHPAVTKGARP